MVRTRAGCQLGGEGAPTGLPGASPGRPEAPPGPPGRAGRPDQGEGEGVLGGISEYHSTFFVHSYDCFDSTGHSCEESVAA